MTGVAVWSGHMFRAPLTPELLAVEQALSAKIAVALAAHDIALGYGALAAGADILVAEAMLARGAALHVVLPFPVAAFKAASVTPRGADWLPRFDAALARAASLTVLEPDGDGSDAESFNRCTQAFMDRGWAAGTGAALLLAIWDGTPARGAAGTAVDVANWRARGGAVEIIDPAGVDRRPVDPEA